MMKRVLLLLLACDACVADDAADTKEVDAVGATAFMVNADRAMAGGFVPTFNDTSKKGEQYLREWREIRSKVPPLFFDHFSPIFFNDFTWKQIYEPFLKYANFDEMDDRGMIIGLRTLFMDSIVRRATENSRLGHGTQQVVYLGAGLDTKALRLHSPTVATFEVDKGAVLDYKLKKLAEVGYPSYPAKLVKGDYTTMDVFTALEKAGLDVKVQTLFVWEGNQMYLPIESSQALLRELFFHVPNAAVVFDNIAASGDERVDLVVQALYDVMNGGKPMWPGRTSVSSLANAVGADVGQSISMYNYALEVLGSEGRIGEYLLNHPDRIKMVKSFGEVMSFNIIKAKAPAGEHTGEL